MTPRQSPALTESPRSRSRKPVAVIGSFAALVVFAASGCLLHHDRDSYSSTSSGSSSKSPEDQIRAVIAGEDQEYNDNNLAFDPQLECEALKPGYAKYVEDYLLKQRAEFGTRSSTLADIQVTGDSATADVTNKFQKDPDNPDTYGGKFVKEGGRWKDCTPMEPPDTDSGGK